MTKGTPGRDERPGGLSAAAWTGDLPQGATPPQPEPEQEWRRLQLVLLLCAILAMWVAWWFLLSLHSPLTPDPPSGHTAPLRLNQRMGATLYVQPWEAAVSTGLAFATFIVPAAWFAWNAIRRRRKR